MERPHMGTHGLYGLTDFFSSKALIMHIFVFSASRSVRIDILFSNSRHLRFQRVFQPSFLPEDDDVNCWNAIPYLVNRYRYCISNFKKIGWKLWPWQCYRFFVQYGGRDVINYDNELKYKLSYVKSLVIYLWKISNFLLE